MAFAVDEILRVGTTVYGWNSVRASFDGVPYTGLLSVDFEQKRERKVVHGMRRDGTPLGKTSGKYSVEGFTLKMLDDSYDMLTTQMLLKGLGSYGDAVFTFVLQLVEPGKSPLIYVCAGCTIDGEKDSIAEGTDEKAVEVTIGALTMTKNGKPLFSLVRGL